MRAVADYAVYAKDVSFVAWKRAIGSCGVSGFYFFSVSANCHMSRPARETLTNDINSQMNRQYINSYYYLIINAC